MNLQQKIEQFVAARSKFPTSGHLYNADSRIWNELTPQETQEMLQKVSTGEYQCNDCDIAFQYWLYWLQERRWRVTNGVFGKLCGVVGGTTLVGLTICRLKYGRRMPTSQDLEIFYRLYLVSIEDRRQLKKEVLK